MSRLLVALVVVILVVPQWSLASASETFEYTAFSFRVAREDGHEDPLRESGITRAVALVYDRRHDDVILIGRKEPGQKPIATDDWVVAIRAILANQADPAVSIDRTEKTDDTGKQKVRFEGGLENTQFGRDLFDADVVLKRLGLGTQSAKVFGLNSYMDFSVDDYRSSGDQSKLVSRFWFHPHREASYVTVRNDVVAVEEYKVGVTNEVMGAVGNIETDRAAQRFAEALQDGFDDIKLYFPELRRMEQLYYVTALAQGLESSGMSQSSLVSYWLNDYQLGRVPTPPDYPVEQNRRKLDNVVLELSGGVSLEALVIDLQDGVADSIKKYALSARPDPDSLSWDVPMMAFVWDTLYDKDQIDALKSQGKEVNLGMSVLKNIFPITSRSAPNTSSFSLTHSPLTTTRSLSFPDSTAFRNTRLTQSPSFGTGPGRIGGVMLSGKASVSGAESAQIDMSGGNFSLIVDGERAKLSPKAFRKFVTALWSVYYSNQDPGISIDPIAPGVDKHLVRYIGRVINTDLGRVMREADFQMKKWSVGTERAEIKGFKNPDEYAAQSRLVHLAPSRFWFVPQDMRFKRSDDMLLFEDGKMTVQTEYLLEGESGNSSPENEKFADFLTTNYETIAKKYPVFAELFDYAKVVSLAKYIKEQGIPLLWFLMANKDLVLTEKSTGTVNEQVRNSEHFREITISGGVDLGFDTTDTSNYVYDSAAVSAIREARAKYSPLASSSTMSSEQERTGTGLNRISFNLGENSYTVVPQHSLTSGQDRNGLRYQTDIALRGRGLQVTQHSLNLLEAELVYKETMREMNPILKTMKQHNLDQDEMIALYKVKEKKARKSINQILEGLRTMKNRKFTDANTFRAALKDAIGVAKTKKLGPLIMKLSYFDTRLELVRYFDPDQTTSGEFGDGWHLLVPYRIKPHGNERQALNNLTIPKKMALVNLLSGEDEILTFNTKRHKAAGYLPGESSKNQVKGLFLMNDGSYRLSDTLGNRFSFDPRGFLTEMIFSEHHRIAYEYVEGFTDRFDQAPYRMEPFGEEMIPFLNVTIPKRMKLHNLAHGKSDILVFRPEGDIPGYVPESAASSSTKIVALMTNGAFRLIDRDGNEIALTSAGEFEKMYINSSRPMVGAVSQGNHRIEFDYGVSSSGNVVIAGAKLSEHGADQSPTIIVQYEYNEEGRLADVRKVDSQLAQNRNIRDGVEQLTVPSSS